MPDIAAVGSALASWGLTYLLHSTLLLGGAWAVQRTGLLRSLRSREALWIVALAGGLVTATAAVWTGAGVASSHIEVRVSRLEWTEAPARLHGVEPQAAAPATISAVCRQALGGVGTPGPERIQAVLDACTPPRGAPWAGVFLALWIAGAMVFAGREVRGHMALRRIRKRMRPPGDRLVRAFQAAHPAAAPEGLRVMVSPDVDAPCVVGRRTIAIPTRGQADLSFAELTAVLAHEVAHVLRRDILWRGALRWLAVVLWFQPLNRLGAREVSDVAELICDDWAVSRIRRPEDLARSIARVAAWYVADGPGRPVLVASQGGSPSARVRRILAGTGGGHRSRRLAGVAVAVLLVVAVAFVPPFQLPAPTGLFVLQEEDVTLSIRESGAPVGPGASLDQRAEIRVLRIRP